MHFHKLKQKKLVKVMNNTLLDNSTDFRMVTYIRELLSNPQCTELKIATGYWDLPGTKLLYDELKAFFERGGKCDLLIGQEPMLRSYMLDEAIASEKFPDFYIRRDVERFHNEYQDVVQLLLEHMNDEDEERAQLRVHVYGQGNEKQFLHAKCYIFLGRGFAHGIIGSSNFTQKGLEENAELNYLETENSVVSSAYSVYSNSKSHLTWFMEKWENSEPWTGAFIQILSSAGTKTPPEEGPDVVEKADGLTPYEVYIRLLEDSFGTDDNMDATIMAYLQGTIYDAQNYQLDAVKQCYGIMKKMGGFLLADVVGLGKTVVGALVIRYYLEHMKLDDGTYNKVLIVAPPAIVDGWRDTFEQLDNGKKFKMAKHIELVSTGMVASFADEVEDDNAKLEFKDKNYGLIIVDESHRFRNNNTVMYNSLKDLVDSATSRPYIGLVSATPQNNRPMELKNQISFFVPHPLQSQFSKIPGRNFDKYFSDVEKQYRTINPTDDAGRKALKALSNDIRNKILNEIIVRRTRKDIEECYPGTIEFPRTAGPNVLKYEMSDNLAWLFNLTVNIIDPDSPQSGIGYHRYSAIARFDKKSPNYITFTKRYEGKNMDVQTTSDRLAKIMKLLLIKRLESSFDAFRESLANLRQYTLNMIDMWNDDTIFICPQLDVNAIIADHPKNRKKAYDELRRKIQSMPSSRNDKGQNAEYHRVDFDSKYINDLHSDYKLIDDLLKRWEFESEDPKLDKFGDSLPVMMSDDRTRMDAFIAQLIDMAYQKNDPQERDRYLETVQTMEQIKEQLTEEKTKLVIFTEAIPTAMKVAAVAESLNYRVLTITAANRKEKHEEIQANFDANYKGVQKDDYDIIVTTEVLAEGVNLHRANAILNYDSPWNATRLIQRIGRVNRIGSQSKAVFVYNFFPSAKGDEHIRLVQNAYRKLQSFHTMFGEDDQVFNPAEELSPAAFNTVVSGQVSWQMPYMVELRNYKEHNAERFEQLKTMDTPLRIAAPAVKMQENTAETLCVVKNTTDLGSFYVALASDGSECNDIPLQLILEHCKCIPETPSLPMIDNYAELEEMAVAQYASLQQQRLTTPRPSRTITEAQRILAQVWPQDDRFRSVKKELSDARRLVDTGDTKMAKTIIKINEDIESKQQSAFPYTADAVADIIRQRMADVVKQASEKFGTTSNFITFNKQ